MEEPPQAQETSYNTEEVPNGFALTPDGEEHFGAPADTAMMASLIDYHNAPVEVQMGLDAAMSVEWQKYTEFNAVVPCTEQEFRDLMKAGHVCIPTKWVFDRQERTSEGNPRLYAQVESTLGGMWKTLNISATRRTSAQIVLLPNPRG